MTGQKDDPSVMMDYQSEDPSRLDLSVLSIATEAEFQIFIQMKSDKSVLVNFGDSIPDGNTSRSANTRQARAASVAAG